MFRKKKKSVKKETQKPQNRHDDEDRATKEKLTKFLSRTLKLRKLKKKITKKVRFCFVVV